MTTNSLPPTRTGAEGSHRSAVCIFDQGLDHRKTDSKPALRSVERSGLLDEEIKKAWARSSGLIPTPIVADGDHRLAVGSCHQEARDVPARIALYLAALLRRLAITWARRRGIGVQRQRSRRERHGQLLPLLDDHRAADLHRFEEQGAEFEALLAELDLALADARYVEQIVEQALHVLDLTRDHAAVFRQHLVVVRVRALEDLDGVEDGRQRVS